MSTQISQEDHEEAIKELQEKYEKNLEAGIAKGVAAALAVVRPTARISSPLHGKSFFRPIYTSPIKNPLPKSSSAASPSLVASSPATISNLTIPDAADGDTPLRALLVATFEPSETFDVKLKTEYKVLAMAEGKQASIADLRTYISDFYSLTINLVTRENCPDKGGYPQQPRKAHSARRPHTFPPVSPIPPTLPTLFRPPRPPKPPKSILSPPRNILYVHPRDGNDEYHYSDGTYEDEEPPSDGDTVWSDGNGF